MRTIFLLFDSLNRRALGPYGGSVVRTPNFDRLAARAVTFDNHYAGSLPCMPARRDLQTGRLNFLHRSWGPLEPFDYAFPDLLRRRGVYSHLVTDHYHYFEEGGCGYHQRYDTWEFARGQENDRWVARVQPSLERFRELYHPSLWQGEQRTGPRLQNLINREAIVEEGDLPSVRTMDAALSFLDDNRQHDDWLLQVEIFDPHEPFQAPARLRADYPTRYSGPILDWPRYRPVDESPEEIEEINANYAALVAHCDEQLGRLLDYLDAHGLWDTTALVVSTDHGILLGEQGWWGKNRMPLYNEIAHLPLFFHHPGHVGVGGSRRSALTQTADLMPTILELYGVAVPEEVTARSLLPLLGSDGTGHPAVIYGLFGGATNVTDGRYTYFCYPDPAAPGELFEYTLLPMHATAPFSAEEMADATLVGDFTFTRGYRLLRIPATDGARRPPLQGGGFADTNSVLFDLTRDPRQSHPLAAPEVEHRLRQEMRRIMQRHEAPPEAYARLKLAPTGD